MIYIGLCVNDENGNNTDSCDYIVIHNDAETLIEMDTEWSFSRTDSAIELDGQPFLIMGYQTMHGSVAYDCAMVQPDVAAEIVNLMRHNGYDWQAGLTDFLEKYDRGDELTADDFAMGIPEQ